MTEHRHASRSPRLNKKRTLALLWMIWSILLVAICLQFRSSIRDNSAQESASETSSLQELQEKRTEPPDVQEKRQVLPEVLGLVCSDCSCQNGSYIGSQSFASSSLATIQAMPPIPLAATGADAVGKTLFHRIVIDNLLAPIFTDAPTINLLMHTALSCPDLLFSYSLGGLKPKLPTLYMYTRTGLSGRLGTRRAKYFDRHIASIREYQQFVEENGHIDGTAAEDRQLIWIVIEDGPILDLELARLLAASGLNYLYIAHGPTRHYGKAQWNLAWKSIEVLHQIFGDGPAVAVDDDALVLPELYLRLWRIKVLIGWQMGNYPTENGWWEGPVFENGKLVTWEVKDHTAHRVFPIDMGAFALNSSVIGRELVGPQYIPADEVAQETEFIEQVRSSREDMEPLCDNTIEDNCKFGWHNAFFSEDQIWDPYNEEGVMHP